MRKFLFVLAVLFGLSSFAKAEFKGGGNTTRIRHVAISTTAKVVLSTEANCALDMVASSNSLKIQEWSYREIINISTCCSLAIFPPETIPGTYSSSYTIILASGSGFTSMGDKRVLNDQEVWYGLWSPGDGALMGNKGYGAIVIESYFNSKKRR